MSKSSGNTIIDRRGNRLNVGLVFRLLSGLVFGLIGAAGELIISGIVNFATV